MLNTIKQFFSENISHKENDQDDEHQLRIATAALLLEMARADFEVKNEELELVASAVEKYFSLTREQTQTLVKLADEQAQQATCYYEFTSLINKGFSAAEKVKVIGLLWDVALSDNHLEKYEEALVRKVADLLYVPHADFIATKLNAIANKNSPEIR